MAVIDLGAASPEQLQAVQRHPAMQGAFAVYVCRSSLLKAGVPAAGVAADAAAAVAAAQAAQADRAATLQTAFAGLVQVGAVNAC